MNTNINTFPANTKYISLIETVVFHESLGYRIRKLLGKEDYYQCPYCGYILLKEDATIFGYDSQYSLRYVHCPRCRRIIIHTRMELIGSNLIPMSHMTGLIESEIWKRIVIVNSGKMMHNAQKLLFEGNVIQIWDFVVED